MLCPVCRTEFAPRMVTQRFCSPACQVLHKNQRRPHKTTLFARRMELAGGGAQLALDNGRLRGLLRQVIETFPLLARQGDAVTWDGAATPERYDATLAAICDVLEVPA